MKIKTINELWNYGIEVIGEDVYRNGLLLKPIIKRGKHKYGKTREYYYYSFYQDKKQVQISKSNIIYCWYIGDRDLDKDIDHINNNTLDDRPENLQLLTRAENLAKREIKGVNQWYYIKNYDKESWNKMINEKKENCLNDKN